VFFTFFRPDPVDLLLTASTDDGISARGSVMYNGAPVPNGQMHLSIEAARSQRYIVSTMVPVSPQGTFDASREVLKVPDDMRNEPVRIRATFVGRVPTGKDKAGVEQYKTLGTTSTLYVGFSPPLLGRTGLWSVVSVTTIVMVGLIVLFTGELTPAKARLLFVSTYLVTFVSVAAPIGLTLVLAQNDYLLNLMQEAPIGLLKGKTKGSGESQWIVNIGGSVRKVTPAPLAPPLPATPPPTAPSAPTTAARPAVLVSPDGTASAEPAPDTSVGRPTPSAARAGDVEVAGGLAVPFYVIFLAMLGAGINMTIQVPRIQLTYTTAGVPSGSFLSATAGLFMKLLWSRNRGVPLDLETVARVRRELIDNYMYLVSAPIIAIALYYLLQVIGSHSVEPMVVILAFATGFTSDKIVARIIEFAESKLVSDEQKAKRKLEQQRDEEVAKKRHEAALAKADADRAHAEADKVKAEVERAAAEKTAEEMAAEQAAEKVGPDHADATQEREPAA
jgi:hypothetical protein